MGILSIPFHHRLLILCGIVVMAFLVGVTIFIHSSVDLRGRGAIPANVKQLTNRWTNQESTSTWSAAGNTTSQDVLSFYQDPERFVERYSNCISDEACTIYYLHTPKTGGSTMEFQMFHLFPVGFDNDSCCNKRMMARFNTHKSSFCTAKFTSYQVHASHFIRILSECMAMHPTSDSHHHHAFVLASFRNPIERTLSYIHQFCNKDFHLRTTEMKQACNHCQYQHDTEVWDWFVNGTNRAYQEMETVLKYALNTDNVETGTIDLVDLNEFFERLHTRLPELHVDSPSTTKNKESLSRCNFGMPSTMLKALSPSLAMYRKLTLNNNNN